MQNKKSILRVFICSILLLIFFAFTTDGQSRLYQPNLLFYQLNTAQGLSDNYINDICADKNGNIWIATGEGLNMFNGKTVVKFFNEEYPQLQNDMIRQVICDEKNRIWVMTKNGNISIIDEYRQFHRVAIYKNGLFVPARRIINNTSTGIILYAENHHYRLNPATDFLKIDSLTKKNFSSIEIKGFDSLYKQVFKQYMALDSENYLFGLAGGFYKINYKKSVVEKKYNLTGLTLLTRWANNKVLAYDNSTGRLRSIDLTTEATDFPFEKITDQHGNRLEARITNAKWINENQLLLTTYKEGFYIFHHKTNSLYHYLHNAADPTTVINNSPLVITTDSSGWVFLGAMPNGISYFKSNEVIAQQSVFLDKAGNSYDGHVNNFTTLDHTTYYIAVSDDVLLWNRNTNTTAFLSSLNKNLVHLRTSGAAYVEFDNRHQLWISMPGTGIYVIDKDKRLMKFMTYDSLNENGIPSNFIRHMVMGPDGFMWLSTNSGVCKVNTGNFKIDFLKNTPLADLKSKICGRTWFEDSTTVWIATDANGAYRYNLKTRHLKKYDTGNGLLTNEVFCFNKDRFNNTYIGTSSGLHIFFKNGGIKTVTVSDGLLNKRIEALLLDKKGRMWIGNDVGLACFNIADTSLKTFDERYGLSVQGFRINSYYQNPDGEMFWGTERGFQYFYPDSLYTQKINILASISQVATRDVVANLTQDAVLKLSPSDNYVTFYFNAVDYRIHLRTFYEYKLEGIDKEWVSAVDLNFVRYNLLPPGEYVFKVRISNDKKNWQEATNKVKIIVTKPFYKSGWIKLLGILVGLSLIWMVINYFRKKQKTQREHLENEVIINYFASQINSHQNTDTLLWDVAKNCISKLRFEDCVIYMKDTDKNMLVQKAAYGPKNPVDFTIHKPIEIPVGKGIVGSVAQTGRSELVNNTEDDDRYIIDDQRRFSEIAVPIIIDNQVIGVIDSENKRKHFFTQRHLQVLSTVAVLCANQIQKTNAEGERQKATFELLENKQKAAESRLQSLRLQMNPHFLFNALNSIQQMILSNEDIVATQYLSRFSKLLRTVLIHSDKETITLHEEIDILKMYIELESVRFKESFSYSFLCDEEIETEEIKIPTLLIQPFVENAIWHGLMHKEGNRHLSISFKEAHDIVQCVVEDNGVGRKKAMDFNDKMGGGKKHTDKGIQVSKERLKSLKSADGKEGSINIIDLFDVHGEPAGTRIEINFPVQT